MVDRLQPKKLSSLIRKYKKYPAKYHGKLLLLGLPKMQVNEDAVKFSTKGVGTFKYFFDAVKSKK